MVVIERFNNFFLFFLTIVCVVIPNSLPVAAALLLLICFLFSIVFFKMYGSLRLYYILFILSWFVTVVYILAGQLNGAPLAAMFQVFIIYIVSPLLWFIILSTIVRRESDYFIIKYILILVFICAFTVALFFYLFNIYGASAVAFFNENANVNLRDGYSGATMHVYGIFIFFAGCFFSAPDVIRNSFHRIIVLCIIFLVAITSGRSALYLSICISFFLYFIFGNSGFSYFLKRIAYSIMLALFIVGASYLLSVFYKINTIYIISNFFDELTSGGGFERSKQLLELYSGIVQSNAFGVGHGVGVDYVRNFDYPWRYELVWVATIYRVGLIGSFVYVLPFIWYAYNFIAAWKIGRINIYDRFFFGGFLTIFISSATNPYIESFIFQWMFILPMVHFFVRRSCVYTKSTKNLS